MPISLEGTGASGGLPMAERKPSVCALALLAGVVTLLASAPLGAQTPAAPPGQSRAPRISVSWTQAPVRDVLTAFARFSGASIVAGAAVSGFVTADINDQPWDVALASILSAHGLVATEGASGIIRVDRMEDLGTREAVEPLLTRTYRISYSRASEIQGAIAPLLTPRGSVSAMTSTNTLVVTDVARVQRAVAALLR